MPRPVDRFWWMLAASLAVGIAVAVPLALLAHRGWTRHEITSALGDDDLARREAALNRLIREAPRDPALADAVIRRYDTLPADAIIQTANALRIAGLDDARVWRPVVDAAMRRGGDDFAALFRWVAGADHEAPGHLTDRAIALYADAAGDEGLRDELFTLIEGEGWWRSPPVPWDAYLQRLLRLADAREPAARLALARRLADLPIDQPGLDVTALREPLRRLLSDVDAAVRHRALYTTANLLPLDQTDTLRNLIAVRLDDPDPRIAALASRLLAAWEARGSSSQTEASTANGPTPSTVAGPIPPWPPGEAEVSDVFWMEMLRALESAPPAGADLGFDERVPHLLRPALTLAAREPSPDWLTDTLRVDDRPALRDLACVVAVERFDEATLRRLVAELIGGLDPEGRMSAAVLSGLSGIHADALMEASGSDSRFAVGRVVQVGLWMQGTASTLQDVDVAGMLTRHDLPTSTVLLAMLHHGQRRAALDALLEPERHTNAELADLLGRRRWALVLHRYLPPDAPRLDVWAGADAFAAQLDALRAWHSVNRFGG